MSVRQKVEAALHFANVLLPGLDARGKRTLVNTILSLGEGLGGGGTGVVYNTVAPDAAAPECGTVPPV